MVRANGCPHCGAQGDGSSSLDGVCLGCLLKLALDTEETDPPEQLVPDAPAIPGYRILSPLGSGGMGEVFLAEEEELGRKVAIKVISKRIDEGRREEAKLRFLREARAMAAVEHPHIVRIYRIGASADGRDFLAMEYVEGGTLADKIKRQGRLPYEEALVLVRQAIDALAAAFDRELIHRDIKPANLFVDGRGHLRVGDFGLARPLDLDHQEAITGLGTLMGTPTYVSPEQARGEKVDHRSDIYSLGIVLFEMLDGAPPFEAKNPLDLIYLHLHQPLPDERPAIPAEIRAVLESMTAKDRELRPSSYEELRATINTLLGGIDSATAVTLPLPSHLAQDILPSPRKADLPLGPLVAKRCNRLRQMMAFAHHFRSNRLRHPGRPLVYLIPGREGQGHESLVERFVLEHVTKALEETSAGRPGGLLRRRIGWPEGGSPGELQTYLETDLFTALDPTYAGLDLSAQSLSRLPALSICKAVIVQHEIRTRRLDRDGLDLVDWYVNQYWGSLVTDEETPLFVIFLNLVHPAPRPMSRWIHLLSIGFSRQRRIERRLFAIFSESDTGAEPGVGRLMLSELDSVHLDHVKEWFNLHNVYETEKERRETAERLFEKAEDTRRNSLPMDEVEFALARIHGDFLRRKGLYS